MASRAVMPRSPAPCVDLGTDSVVTNAQVQEAPAAPPAVCGCRWKIAPWPRAGTQGTEVQHCQGRTALIQCHPLGSACLVGVRLKELAAHTGRTGDQLTHGLLDDSLMQQLRNPSRRMILA